MILLAVDPGLGGALALLDAGGDPGAVTTVDMPTHLLARGGRTKREIDAAGLVSLVVDRGPVGHAFIEQVGAMPSQGTSGVFALGKGYEVILAVLAALAVPITLVAPVKWKRALGAPAAKDGAQARASQLMPGAARQWPLVKHGGSAEAALLAVYRLRSLHGVAQ
jgi:crossover junction endodeoxyribonuclease RuvC